MDPLSALFVSYLELVSHSLSGQVTDIMGTELQTVGVKHQGITIPYNYQLWRIRPSSVCARYRNEMGRYSPCTVAARSLFEQTCQTLQARTSTHCKHRKLENMYCAAAVDYQPTLATLERSKENTPLDAARTASYFAIAAAMGNSDPALQQ